MNIINKTRNLLKDLNDTILTKNIKIEYINSSILEYSRNIENFTFSILQFDNNQNCFLLPSNFNDLIELKSNENYGELREYVDFMINKKEGKIFIINSFKYDNLYIQYNKKFEKLFEGNLIGEYIIGDIILNLEYIGNLEIGETILIGDGNNEEECIIKNIVGNQIELKTGLTKIKSEGERIIGDLKINDGDEELIFIYFNYLYKSFNNIVSDGNEENWSQGQVSQTIKYNSSSTGKSYLSSFNEKIKQNPFYKFKEVSNGDSIGNIKINII